jgi:hypothetical protein
MLRAITDKYGAFGLLARERGEILRFFEGFDHDRLAAEHAAWVETVMRIREARRPERLAAAYAASLSRGR